MEVRRFSTTTINKKGGNKPSKTSTVLFSKSSFSTSTTNVGGNNNSGLGSDSGGGGCKLASARAAAVINLLPSYLLDARSITQYHPITSPHGALQLSVAENQLSELVVDGLVGILEGGE